MLHHSSIETDNLILSPVALSDAEEMFPQFTEEVTVYMMPKAAESIQDIIAFIEQSLEQSQAGTDFIYTIRRKSDALFLGVTGIHCVNTEAPVFGIWIRKDRHGQGIGRALITALYQWASAHIKAEYFIYPVDKDNTASRRIPEALGGTVQARYSKTSLSGRTLNLLEYHLLPK